MRNKFVWTRLNLVPAYGSRFNLLRYFGRGATSSKRFCSKTLILLFLAIVCVNACRSHKKATAPVMAEGAFYTSCYPIESLFVPTCKLEITDGNQTFSLNGSIYIRPDSVCYFTGRMLMIEALRGAIYRDSFLVVNYIDRICYKGKNDYLQRMTGFPVNPESLMMLFTADRCEEAYRNKLGFIAATGSADKIMMQGANRSLLEMNINANDRTIENIALRNNQQRLSATYSDYEQYPQFAIPTVFDISAFDGQKNYRIKANFQQILFNRSQRVNISVSSRFEVVVLR